MGPNDHALADESEEIDVVALWRVVWRFKVLIALICCICVGIAVALALNTIPFYRAQVVITPAHEEGETEGGLSGQFGGALQSLVGLSLTPANSSEAEANAVLDSRHLAEEFIKRNQLLGTLSGNAKQPLTLWLAVNHFKGGVLTIRSDAGKGLTTVSVEWTDPVTAARWANGFVALANELIRTRAMDDATRNIAYLNGQIGRTSEVELRQVLYDIIKNETKTLMLANGRGEYAFEVIDPAVPPEVKAGPHRALIMLMGLMGGVFLSFVLVFTIEWIRRQRRAAAAH